MIAEQHGFLLSILYLYTNRLSFLYLANCFTSIFLYEHSYSMRNYVAFPSCSLARQHGRSVSRRFLATIAHKPLSTPQTVIEKVVQKYAVGLPEGKIVKAGDYVMIRPEHVMTHDNTGPVVSKCAAQPFALFNCKFV